jgi:lysophospholipase L1-like esterase
MKRLRPLLCLLTFIAGIPSAPAGEPRLIREGTEWCDIWIAHADKTDLPRVLLIGDSITRGYYGEVEKRLTGKAYVARLATSRFLADPVFAAEVKLILSEAKFDVIHFNNGMHGWGYTEEEYRQFYPQFIALLRQGAPAAKLICANTTPVRVAGKNTELDPKTERARVRNAIANEFAAKENIPMDDLFTLVIGHPEYNDAGGIHFTSAGIQAQAGQVAAEIAKYLPH